MREIYESPELEISAYEIEDVITASFGDNDFQDPWGNF